MNTNTELPLGDHTAAILLTAAGSETASAQFLEKLLGVNDKQLRDLVAQGLIPPPLLGQYRLAETVAGVVAWLRKRLDKKDNLPVFPSLKNCAGRTGIPVQFLESAKSGGCPGFDSSGRVHLEKILAWIFNKNPDGEINRDWGEVYEKFRALNEQLKHDKLSAELMPRSIALECSRQLNQIFFAQLDRQSNEFATMLAGCDPAKIKTTVETFNDGIRASIIAALENLEKDAESQIAELSAPEPKEQP
jgi:hypothetical protein